MKYQVRSEKGFTLIEIMIALLIITVVTSISFGSLKHAYLEKEHNYFLDQLKLDLYYAQQLAISLNSPASFVFNNTTKQYTLRQGSKAVLSRQIPDEIILKSSTLSLNDIVFLNDGNVRKTGTIILEVGDKYYKLVLLLGRGRFYIEKI